MSRRHWANAGENTFVLGIWLLYGVHRWFGRRPFLLMLYPVVLFYWLTRGTARRASREYLERLQATTAVLPSPPTWRDSLGHFLRFGQTLLDKLLAVGGRYAPERVRFEGHEAILRNLEQGQGGVIVTAHLGCLELLQCAAGRRERLKLTVLVHTAHAERFNRVLSRINPDAGVRLMQVDGFSPAMAMLLSDRIKAGEFIAIAGDRVPVRGDRVVQADFLGHTAAFPIGPYVIASLLECPVYLLACLREGSGYRVVVEQLAEQVRLPRASRTEALGGYVAHYARWLEARLRESPLDWFNFFPFWGQASHVSSSR